MFSLFFLGNFCEQLIGRKRLIWLYLLAGIFAGTFFVLGTLIGSGLPWGPKVFGDIDAMAAGASGALFGLLGLLAMLMPRYKVYLIVGPIIVFVILAIIETLPSSPATFTISILLNIILFVMIFSLFIPSRNLRRFSIPVALPMWLAPVVAIVPLIVISFAISLPIGNSAHLGGLIFGLAYGTYLRLKYPQKMLLLKRFFR
jgi:membrane associated rhomboid family serine protease